MNNINLYNTLDRKLTVFNPIDSSNVRMYACGPTVYDYIHIGNARPLVVFDVLVRVLRTLYPKVTYVRNITDIDDKINNRALEKNISISDLTEAEKEPMGGSVGLFVACVLLAKRIIQMSKLGFLLYAGKASVLSSSVLPSCEGETLTKCLLSSRRIHAGEAMLNTSSFIT
jgi:hypothetical protein